MAQDPGISRRRLRSQLRELRERSGITQRDAAQAMEWSLSKLIRIETGAVSISVTDLRSLLAHYGVTGEECVQPFVELARGARAKSPFARYGKFTTPEFLTFLEYESSAGIIRSFQPFFVPGLLQTEEYATEILRYIRGSKDETRISGLVELRSERQDRLFGRPDPPDLWFMIDEAVLRRWVGGRQMMIRQLERLVDVMAAPFVSLRVIPFTLGMYRSLRVPYVIFEFDDDDDTDDVLYLEQADGERLARELPGQEAEENAPTSPVTYLEIFWELEALTSPEESLRLIEDALQRLRTSPSPPPVPEVPSTEP